jgi:cytidine deaminase
VSAASGRGSSGEPDGKAAGGTAPEAGAEVAVDDQALLARALAARARAYAPYSGFQVGAVAVAGGKVYEGANVENASYGLCICAERNAVARAVLDGQRDLELVCVAADATPPAGPCGMCRQTLAEFSADPAKLRILCINLAGERADYTLAELLPHGFTRSQLDTAAARGGGKGDR